MKGHLASQCKVNVTEAAAEEDGEVAIWGAIVICEVQDIDVAGNTSRVLGDTDNQEILVATPRLTAKEALFSSAVTERGLTL